MNDAKQAFLNARQFLLDHREDYDHACAHFKWPQLDDFNWALDYFDPMARGNHQPALWIVEEDGSEQKLSFDDLHQRSNQAANWLRDQGVKRGDRVLIMLANERPLWEAMLALIKLGAVMIPTSTLLVGDDLQDRFDRGEVRHVIVGASHTAKFDAIEGGHTRIVVGSARGAWRAFDQAYQASNTFTPQGITHANDPLLLYFTSGTTSKPKLVLHSHQSYPVGHLSTMYWIGLKPGDVHLNISSPGWAKHAWSCFFAPWNAQACVFIHNYARFNATALLDVITAKGVTSLCAPPTVWRMLIQTDLGAWKVQLRELVGAGEPLNPEVIEQVRQAWGLTIRDGFGQSETTCQVGNSPGQPIKDGSMGRPLPGYKVTLLNVYDQADKEGEISLDLSAKPLGLMLGYDGDEAKTREVMRQGHYRTGDVAERDEQGYIRYVGRADDVFKSSDYRISPFELESVLIEHPDVVEAAVIPSPDPLRLNVPKAIVVLREGVTPDAETARRILAFAREHLAPYKRIRRIAFAVLPKTISGKIQRAVLRKAEASKASLAQRDAMDFDEEDFPDLNAR